MGQFRVEPPKYRRDKGKTSVHGIASPLAEPLVGNR
jgi:hypothetical protein